MCRGYKGKEYHSLRDVESNFEKLFRHLLTFFFALACSLREAFSFFSARAWAALNSCSRSRSSTSFRCASAKLRANRFLSHVFLLQLYIIVDPA